jgi:hypothetical protein
MADIIADITTYSNQALLDAAEWSGVSVWTLIAAVATVIIIILLLAIWLIERRHEAPVNIYTDEGQLEFVEKTLAEFPADRIRIEGKKGKVVIKLISPKPVAEEELLPPQEVKGEALPSKVEKAKPPISAESKKEEEVEKETKPIAMGAVGAVPKKPQQEKEETK